MFFFIIRSIPKLFKVGRNVRSRYDIVWLPLKRYCVPLSNTSNAWKNMCFELQNSSPIWSSFLYTLAVLLFLNSNGVLFSFANLFFAFLEGIWFIRKISPTSAWCWRDLIKRSQPRNGLKWSKRSETCVEISYVRLMLKARGGNPGCYPYHWYSPIDSYGDTSWAIFSPL